MDVDGDVEQLATSANGFAKNNAAQVGEKREREDGASEGDEIVQYLVMDVNTAVAGIFLQSKTIALKVGLARGQILLDRDSVAGECGHLVCVRACCQLLLSYTNPFSHTHLTKEHGLADGAAASGLG